jgi:hypothetical protein
MVSCIMAALWKRGNFPGVRDGEQDSAFSQGCKEYCSTLCY